MTHNTQHTHYTRHTTQHTTHNTQHTTLRRISSCSSSRRRRAFHGSPIAAVCISDHQAKSSQAKQKQAKQKQTASQTKGHQAKASQQTHTLSENLLFLVISCYRSVLSLLVLLAALAPLVCLLLHSCCTPFAFPFYRQINYKLFGVHTLASYCFVHF